MLTKIFRPKWQHKDPAVRGAYIQNTPTIDQAILSKLVAEDTDADVRLAAFKKLDSIEKQCAWAQAPAQDSDKAAFRQALFNDIDKQAGNLPVKPHTLSLLKSYELTDALLAYTDNPQVLNQLINDNASQAELLGFLKKTKHSRLRLQIATRLTAEQEIKAAYTWAKNKDKRLAKLLKEKLEDIGTAQEQLKAEEIKAQKVRNKLSIILKQTDKSTPLNAQLDIAEQTLASIDLQSLPESLSEALLSDLAKAKAQIQSLEEAASSEAEQKALAQARKRQQQDFSLAVNTLEAALYSGEVNAIEASLSALEMKAKSEQDRSTVSNLKDIYSQTQALNNLLSTLPAITTKEAAETAQLSLNKLTNGLPKDSHWQQTAKNAHHNLNNIIKSQIHASKEQVKSFKQLSKQLDKALDEKQVEQARALYKQLKSSYQALPDASQRPLRQTYSRLSKATHQLYDWQRFSEDPIRDQLIEQMTRLADNDMDAHDKTKAIKALQNEWKNLGPSSNQSAWETFQAASQKAYEPCNEAFEKEKVQRAFNQTQREQICLELETFIEGFDFGRADFKALDKLLAEVLTEWKRFSPVDRRVHESLQTRFNESVKTLKNHLIEHKNNNLQKLKAIADKASALLDTEDVHAAIQTHKALMNDWKAVGITFRKEQQVQWSRMQGAADQLYGQLKTQKQAAKNEQRASLTAYEEQLNVFERDLEQLTAERSLNDTDSKQKHLDAIFSKLDDLPKKDASRLKQQWQKLSSQYQLQKKAIEQAQWKEKLSQFKALAEALPSGNAFESDAFNTLPESWKNSIQEEQIKWQQANNQHHEKTANDYCLDLEILCDKPSPEGQEQARIERQMVRLKENFAGVAKQSTEKQIEALYIKWFGQPKDFLKANEALTTRFLLVCN